MSTIHPRIGVRRVVVLVVVVGLLAGAPRHREHGA